MADLSVHDTSLLPLSRLPAWRHSPLLAYGFGLIAFAVAFAARLQLDPVLPAGVPFLTFFPAVILTTFVAGFAPGVLVTIISALAAWYAFIPPVYAFAQGPCTAEDGTGEERAAGGTARASLLGAAAPHFQ